MREFIVGNRKFFILWTGWMFVNIFFWSYDSPWMNPYWKSSVWVFDYFPSPSDMFYSFLNCYNFQEFLIYAITPGVIYILVKLWRGK